MVLDGFGVFGWFAVLVVTFCNWNIPDSNKWFQLGRQVKYGMKILQWVYYNAIKLIMWLSLFR